MSTKTAGQKIGSGGCTGIYTFYQGIIITERTAHLFVNHMASERTGKFKDPALDSR